MLRLIVYQNESNFTSFSFGFYNILRPQNDIPIVSYELSE